MGLVIYVDYIHTLMENPVTMGLVERYHAPLRAAFTKIGYSMERDTSDAECL